MTLVVKRSHGRDFSILTSCPACGYEFDPEERRHVHLSDHTPEDFGLAPIGERNEEAQQPLWDAEDSDPSANPERWSA